MKTIMRFLTVSAVVSMASIFLFGGVASAFTSNRIIDDQIFDNYTSMTPSQINSFLNGFSNSCISSNNGFAAPDVTGYTPSGSYSYGGNVTAGVLISHIAEAYGINPQVLLTTLQKEQSLVSGGSGCSVNRYAAAVGYGCPDSGSTYSYSGVNLYTKNGVTVTSVSNTCVNSSAKVGFSQQLIRAAWLLKFAEQRSEGNIGWAVIKNTSIDNWGNSWNTHWDNSDDPQSCYSGPMTQGYRQTCPSGATTYYDGYRTIDGVSTHIDTGATAALYWYTPHFSGNQNFQNLFQNWFGPTTTSGFTWSYVSQNQYTDSSKSTLLDPTNIIAGQRVYVTVQVKNTGVQTWTKGVVSLGTSQPSDRASSFRDSTWPSANRAATLDQATVAPGETGSFSFWMKAPDSTGTYKEYFNLVADGYTWMNDMGMYWQFTVKPRVLDWQYQGQSAYTDSSKSTPVDLTNATPGKRYYVTFSLKNTGNVTWLQNAFNLGTSQPRDRASSFRDSTWPSANRAATLDQATVAPGETGSFSFWIRSSPNTGGNLKEYFSPVDDGGGGWATDYGLYWLFKQPDPQYKWQYESQSAYTDSSKSTPVDLSNIAKGQRFYLSMQLKNTGNAMWYPGGINLGTTHALNRSSSFVDGTWLSSNRAASVADITAPTQSTTFNFWVTAPSNSGTYKEYFAPVADNITWFDDYGLFWQMTVH